MQKACTHNGDQLNPLRRSSCFVPWQNKWYMRYSIISPTSQKHTTHHPSYAKLFYYFIFIVYSINGHITHKVRISIILKQNKHRNSWFSKFIIKWNKRKNSTIKTIYSAKIEIKEEKIILTFCGNGFLRYMVRVIVWVLIQVGN